MKGFRAQGCLRGSNEVNHFADIDSLSCLPGSELAFQSSVCRVVAHQPSV